MHKDCFLLNGARSAAMLSGTNVNFFSKHVFVSKFSPREEHKET